jgi:uncharacterized protein (TIGR03435 family)
MIRRQPSFQQYWNDFFRRYQKLPPPDANLAWDRVMDRLRDHPDDVSVDSAFTTPATSFDQPKSRWRVWVLIAAGAMVLVLVVFMRMPAIRNSQQPGDGLHAVVESADGGLFRVSGGQSVRAGELVSEGDIVRTDQSLGALLTLADGSRIEMRPQSALSLERASDGARIRLDTGGVIITAAKQRIGHLYVQTKDVTVAVIGTVFLVSTEQAGSRVAVIQGEVQVRQGAVNEKLAPGQQIATNPLMESHPVREEISWSRQSEAHIALLQQSIAIVPGAAVVSSKKPEFDAATLKSFPLKINDPNPPKWFIECRGVDGVWSLAKDLQGRSNTPSVPVPQGRCMGAGAMADFIAVAFGIRRPGRVSGHEGVEGLEYYQLEAKAENPSTATKEELLQMLQSMVMDRFKLRAHRYSEERQGFVLLVAKNGVKFKETSGDEDAPMMQPLGTWVPGTPGLNTMLLKGKFGLKTFAQFLTLATDGLPVIDKTELSGIYDISLKLNQVMGGAPAGPRGGGTTTIEWDPSLAKALEDQLGLRLDSVGKVPVENLAVDHVEKPSDN